MPRLGKGRSLPIPPIKLSAQSAGQLVSPSLAPAERPINCISSFYEQQWTPVPVAELQLSQRRLRSYLKLTITSIELGSQDLLFKCKSSNVREKQYDKARTPIRK